MSLSNGIGNGIGMKRRTYSPAAPPPEERSQAETRPAVEVKAQPRGKVWQALISLFPKVRYFFIGNGFWRRSLRVVLAVSALLNIFTFS